MSLAESNATHATHFATRSRMQHVRITKEIHESWQRPNFQRPLKVNQHVLDYLAKIKANGRTLPGVLTLGLFEGQLYLVDGQHRIEAFKMSELPEIWADVRVVEYDSQADMADAWYAMNSQLVPVRPDDKLRAAEESTPALAFIRARCPFVGYENIRRGAYNPILSMSQLLRSWYSANQETPGATSRSVSTILEQLTMDDAVRIVDVLDQFHQAWGRGAESHRLWNALNLTMCMWIYLRCVAAPASKTARSAILTREQFVRCLMALSADGDYNDWLFGRTAKERDRSPCYGRIKKLFTARLAADTGRKVNMPYPPWAKV